MANHIIKEPRSFSNILRKLEISDPNHADTFNPLYETLINNDAYLQVMKTGIFVSATEPVGVELNPGDWWYKEV